MRPDWRDWAGKTMPGTVFVQPEPSELIDLTVIVPARNEEDCLSACLQSLVSQSEEIFELGHDWDLVVVDDHSTDRTAEIARGFRGVTLIEAEKLETGWTGKANAVWTAAQHARGRWLLFTDADTVHEPGDLRRAMHEAERHKAGMLSYSPRQIVSGFAQRSLMPLVFCELALAYPPAKVSDPAQRIAAANGQFLLVEREAYRKIGGHASVAGKVLEDVELAHLAKRRKIGLRFRYADDAVSARMYRSTGGHDRRLDEKPETALRQRADACLLAGPRFSPALRTAHPGLQALERATGHSFAPVARRRLDSCRPLAAHDLPLLCARGQVEFSLRRLRHLALGIASFCHPALPQLVSAPDPQTGKLEGTELITRNVG